MLYCFVSVLNIISSLPYLFTSHTVTSSGQEYCTILRILSAFGNIVNKVGLAGSKETSWLDVPDIEGRMTSGACIPDVLRAKIHLLIHQLPSNHLFCDCVISKVAEQWRWNDHRVSLQPWECSNMRTTYFEVEKLQSALIIVFAYMWNLNFICIYTLFHLEV